MGDRVCVSGFDSRRRHFISVCNQPPRSIQPFTFRGTVKWLLTKRRWCSATGKVTSNLAESNSSLPLCGWLKSPAGWLPIHRDQLRAQRLVTSMGNLYLYNSNNSLTLCSCSSCCCCLWSTIMTMIATMKNCCRIEYSECENRAPTGGDRVRSWNTSCQQCWRWSFKYTTLRRTQTTSTVRRTAHRHIQ